jgi:hypothetical protein
MVQCGKMRDLPLTWSKPCPRLIPNGNPEHHFFCFGHGFEVTSGFMASPCFVSTVCQYSPRMVSSSSTWRTTPATPGFFTRTEIRGYPMLAAGLGNTPAPQTFLDNLPLLFRAAFHLCFTTHAASSFGGPYPTLGRRSVLEGCSTGSYQALFKRWRARRKQWPLAAARHPHCLTGDT